MLHNVSYIKLNYSMYTTLSYSIATTASGAGGGRGL